MSDNLFWNPPPWEQLLQIYSFLNIMFQKNIWPKSLFPWKVIPTSGRAVLHSKLVDGRCQVQSPVALVEPFGVFRRFLRNSRKFELGSIRKTHIEGHSPYRPKCHKRTIGLNSTTQPCPWRALFHYIYHLILISCS